MNTKDLNPFTLLAIYLFPSASILSSAYLISHNHPIFGSIFFLISIISLPFWRH